MYKIRNNLNELGNNTIKAVINIVELLLFGLISSVKNMLLNTELIS